MDYDEVIILKKSNLLQKPACVICGKEAAVTILTYTNPTDQPQDISDCAKKTEDYCVEHDPAKQEKEKVQHENT